MVVEKILEVVMLPVNQSVIGEALFETRPYVEYWDKLKELVEELSTKARGDEHFLELLEREILNAQEPFKTDLRIFYQKFKEVLKSGRRTR